MKLRTLTDVQWDILIEAAAEAPHGYKEKAKQRVAEFAHDQLRRETSPKARQRDKAA
jgi:hypothetical protein